MKSSHPRAGWSLQESWTAHGFTSLTTWAGSSPGAFACFRKHQHIPWEFSAFPQRSNRIRGGCCCCTYRQPRIQATGWRNNLKIHLTSSLRCFSGSSSFMILSFSARFFSSRRDWAASCLCTWVSLRKFSSTRALFLSAFCLPFWQREGNAVHMDFPISRMQDLW